MLALNSMHWQGMLLSCPAGAVQKVWPWQRMPPSAEPDNRWQVVVKHRIQYARICYQRQILYFTYTPEIVWHFLRIQMYFQTMQFLGSPHRWGTDFLLCLIGEFSEFSLSCNHSYLFYYKYMVGTERMSRVVENFLLPMPDKFSANNSVIACWGYLSGMNNKASY